VYDQGVSSIASNNGAASQVDSFCCHAVLAQGGLLETLRLGLQVPQEVAGAGFDSLGGSNQTPPPLTTMRICTNKMGTRGLRHAARHAAKTEVKTSPAQRVAGKAPVSKRQAFPLVRSRPCRRAFGLGKASLSSMLRLPAPRSIP
jgi:DNA-binding LacI/PurR family transcriptional regulator